MFIHVHFTSTGDLYPESESKENKEDPEWVKTERDQFFSFRDKNKDGKMDRVGDSTFVFGINIICASCCTKFSTLYEALRPVYTTPDFWYGTDKNGLGAKNRVQFIHLHYSFCSCQTILFLRLVHEPNSI